MAEKVAPTEYADLRSYLWGIVQRKVIPERGGTGRPYLIRWHIKLPFDYAIYLHKICLSDPDRDLHDHPWQFCSILVWGRYWEITPTGERWVRWINVKRATDPHRVVIEKPVYTVVLRGRRTREFGFYTDKGWMHWRRYNALTDVSEVI